MRKIILFVVLLVGFIILSTNPAKTKVKSYYSGDAINFNSHLVVASTDSDNLEIFTLESDGLKRQMMWRPFDRRFNKDDNFYGVKLNIEDNKLYAYVISGFTLYKYDISSLDNAVLIKESKNTYWEWYNRIDKFGDNIITVSSNGVKVFNYDLEVIDAYDLTNETPYNISSGGSENLIFSLDGANNEIVVFNRNERKVSNNLLINFYGGRNNRSLYYDSYDNNIYFADDRSVKKVGLNGALKGYFEHLGYPGYDVSSSGNEFLYFANGLGVVKIKKADMSVATSRKTGSLTVNEGWAMGLKTVSMSNGEKIVVFNNSSIIVFDNNLAVLGYFVAGQEDKTYVKENLFLNLNSASVDSGSQIQISGGGYLPGENLVIAFYNNEYNLTADNDGRFSKVVIAPELSNSTSRNRVFSSIEDVNGSKVRRINERTDIKVTGETSQNSYSISLEIKDAIIEN